MKTYMRVVGLVNLGKIRWVGKFKSADLETRESCSNKAQDSFYTTVNILAHA